ncbi:MAG: hypothetical protein GY716_00100 [bacterium]|nr:hypothetical protein [bacterium]
MGLTTTTAGAFPKPNAVRAARWKFAEGMIDEAALKQAEQPAIRDALALQSSIGLDLPVDGQIDRGDLVSSFLERLEGVESGGLVRCYGNRYYRRPRIVDTLARNAAVTVDGWKRCGDSKVRAVIPGPYTLMDWSFDEHHGSREECCRALAAIVRDEAQELLEAGAAEIQIDEPALSARPDEMPLAAEALQEVVAPLAGKARTWARVCYGDYARVLPGLLGLPVDVVYVDLVASEVDLLDALPEDKTFAAGVVEAANPEAVSSDVLSVQLEGLLKKVPAERLIVGTDAGLQALTVDQARAKLANMVEAASRF